MCDVSNIMEPFIMCWRLGYGIREVFSVVLVGRISLELGIEFNHE
jgi:hypothetical protein